MRQKREKKELNGKENNSRKEKTEEREMKGHACCSSHYSNSLYFILKGSLGPR